MVPMFGSKNVLEDWTTVKTGILRLIDFLKGELHLESDMFIEAQNTLVPLVLILSKKDVKGSERDLLAYAYLICYINRRYSGVKFVNLDKDIKLITESKDPIGDWVKSLEKSSGNITYFKPEDIIEDQNRTLKLALFVLLIGRGVNKDLLGRNFLEIAASQEDRPEFHHIFPKKCLEGTRFHEQRDHIANLTVITSKSNKQILNKKPDYLMNVENNLKEQHFIPKDKELYKIERYDDFISRRQELIAEALNTFLQQKKHGT